MNEDEIARGVSRGMREHEHRRAEGDARALLVGLMLLAVFLVGFILLVTYGG